MIFNKNSIQLLDDWSYLKVQKESQIIETFYNNKVSSSLKVNLEVNQNIFF